MCVCVPVLAGSVCACVCVYNIVCAYVGVRNSMFHMFDVHIYTSFVVCMMVFKLC